MVPNNSIDVTITSPPYGPLKDYGSDRQIGRGQSYEEFLVSLSLIFTQIFICTRKTGSLWVVADTFKDNSKIRLLPSLIVSQSASEEGPFLQAAP